MKFLIIIPALALLAYFPSLNYYFSQDDFIHLSASKISSIPEFLNFFNPFFEFPDMFFYRPLSTQVYFFVNQSLFGLNPLPFRIEAILIHVINSLLFYFIVKSVWKNPKIAFLSGMFYAVSATHFLSIFYISGFQEVFRAFFIFLSILLFFKFKGGQKKYLLGSILSFIAALLCKENSIILPAILPILEIIRKNSSLKAAFKENLKPIVPFFIISVVFLAIRVIGIQTVFEQGGYSASFSILDLFQNLKWYILWSFGLPEVLSTYPSLKPNSLLQFGKDLSPGNLVLALSSLLGVIMLFLAFTTRLPKKLLIFNLLIFLITTSPALILQGHRYPYYLNISLLGFLPLLSLLFDQKGLKNILAMVGIIVFVTLQFFSLRLSEDSHWTTHRSKVAEYYYQSLTKNHPTLPENSTVVFVGGGRAPKELSVALTYHYALSLWYPGKIKEIKYLTPEEAKNWPQATLYPITLY